jgi:hypothetical protein
MDFRRLPQMNGRGSNLFPLRSVDEENERIHLELASANMQRSLQLLQREMKQAQQRLRRLIDQKVDSKKGGVNPGPERKNERLATNGKKWVDAPMPVPVPQKVSCAVAIQEEIIRQLGASISYYERTIASLNIIQ